MDTTKQPFWLISIQFVLLLGLFWVRYLYYPLPVEFHLFGDISAAPPIWGESAGISPANWINYLAVKFPLPAAIAGSLLIVWNAMAITKSIGKHLIYAIRTYLPLLFYVVVSCGILMSAANLAAVVSATLTVAACKDIVWLAAAKKQNLARPFRCAFLLGIALLLNPATIYCVLLVPVAIIIFKRSGRELALALAGYCVPVLGWAYIVWGTGGEFTEVFSTLWCGVYSMDALLSFQGEWNLPRTLLASMMGLVVLLAALGFMGSKRKMRTRTVRVGGLMVLFFILSATALLFSPEHSGMFAVAAIPAAFVCPFFFIRFKGIFSDLMYLMVIAGLVTVNLLPFAT